MRIMLIDDDILTLDLLRNALIMNGYECDVFDEPFKALNEYSAGDYDIVACDYFLPDINGIELYRVLSLLNSDPIFILISAFPDRSIISEAISEGITDFLTKPIDWQELRALLDFYQLAYV